MKNSIILLSLLILSVSVCFSIELLAPTQMEVQNGTMVDLGSIGPGQTVSLQMNPTVTTGGIYGNGGTYDYAIVSDLPFNWTSSPSTLYGNPLQVTITAAPDASEGDYYANVTMVNEYNGEQLGNFTFPIHVHITYNVMTATITPTEQTTGPGQPAEYEINITNLGSTSDVFQVSAQGPKRWAFTKSVFVPALSSQDVHYEIVGDEPGTYVNTISVVSTASSIISSEQNVTLNVQSSIFGDYASTNHGTLIFPLFQAPAYGLAGLISNLWAH